jgi:hypothetical protein
MPSRKARAAETLPDTLPAQDTGMQTEAAEAVQVRVLVACYIGKPNDVATLDPEALAIAVGAGLVDPNPDAVAAALALR